MKKLPPDLKRARPGVEPGSAEWAEWKAEMEEYLGYRICGHKNRNGIPCSKPPIAGRDRCRNAGGKTLVGTAAPNFKHGRDSQVAAILPDTMREKYNQLMGDGQLLALSSDIALTDIRQQELLHAIATGSDPMGALRAARKAAGDLSVAIAEGNVGKTGEFMLQLQEALNAGMRSDQLWGEWQRLGNHKKGLSEAEGKRMERMGHYMTAEQVRVYNAQVMHIFQKAAEENIPLEYRRPFLTAVLVGIALHSGIRPQEDTAA